MVTFKPVVFHQVKPKNGAYNVKIRITYKGVSRFLPTTLYCSQADLTRQGKIKPCNTLTKGNELCDRMRATLSDVSPFTLDAHDVDWVVQHIKASMQVESFALDFFEWADEVLAKKKPQTARVCYLAVNSFKEFCHGRIDINDITASLLTEFMEWVDSSPMKRGFGRGQHKTETGDVMHNPGAGARKVNYLRAIYKDAQAKYNDEDADRILIPKYPFGRINLRTPPAKGQKAQSMAVVQMLIDYKPTTDRTQRARDFFLISFLLMGANMADLYDAVPPKDGIWEYHRAKTKDKRADEARMVVYVPDEVQPYIERYKDHTGSHWLNLYREYINTETASRCVSVGLDMICKELGIPTFTMYAARKSWATIARQQGIEKATIDECLAHIGEYKVADIYIEKNWDIINAANAKVISLFKW